MDEKGGLQRRINQKRQGGTEGDILTVQAEGG